MLNVAKNTLDVLPTSDPVAAFKDVDAAILVGAMPRKEGMERKDLLKANVKIFKVQGQALDQHAKKTVKVAWTQFILWVKSKIYADVDYPIVYHDDYWKIISSKYYVMRSDVPVNYIVGFGSW